MGKIQYFIGFRTNTNEAFNLTLIRKLCLSSSVSIPAAAGMFHCSRKLLWGWIRRGGGEKLLWGRREGGGGAYGTGNLAGLPVVQRISPGLTTPIDYQLAPPGNPQINQQKSVRKKNTDQYLPQPVQGMVASSIGIGVKNTLSFAFPHATAM